MDRDVECPGYDISFVSNAAVVLHLEAGKCQSGSDCDLVDRVGWESRFSTTGQNSGNGYWYECPDCQKEFRLMSALLQHEASSSCDVNDFDGLEDFWQDLWTTVRYMD